MNFKRVAIIGGAGKMGRWFSIFFIKEGFNVVVSGRTKDKLTKLKEELPSVEIAENNVDAIRNADLIVLSILLQNFESVVKEIGPYVKPEQTVIDITSVKEIPIKLMHRHIKGCIMLGTHPVFGPSVKDYCQNFVLTPTDKREKEFAENFRLWLEEKGFKVSIMSPKKHDNLMGTILGLSHLIGLVTCDTWINSNFRELKKVSGTSFKLLYNLVENVVYSDPEFYSELQMSLPTVSRIEARFEHKVRKWLRIVKSKNRKKFANEMRKLGKTLYDLR